MANRPVELQRKDRYKASIAIANGTTYDDVLITEFTPPDRRREPVKRQTALGQVSLVGPVDIGEMTLRAAFRISDAANPLAALLGDLQSLHESDYDTCDVSIMMVQGIADSSGALTEQVTYKQSYHNCRVTGYKFDALNRRGDDDFVHVDITLQPQRVTQLQGAQMEL